MTKNNEVETVKKVDSLTKLQVSSKEVLKKQEGSKKAYAQSILDKYAETDEEYDARIEELRKKDFVMTSESKLGKIDIPGYRGIWASTDPKAHPSIPELKKRGYRQINMDLVPTGSHSVEGAGLHIPMICPEDIALKRERALKNVADERYNMVLQEKKFDIENKDNFGFQKNTLTTFDE